MLNYDAKVHAEFPRKVSSSKSESKQGSIWSYDSIITVSMTVNAVARLLLEV